MTGWGNWAQKLLDDQMDMFFKNPKLHNQTNQLQTQIMTDWSNLLLEATQIRSFHEEAVKHDRTGQPVVDRDASHESGDEQSMLNEVDIDFRIPGLPHSVVKQAESSRVRELIKKIESHPHRHALQLDLQQNSLQPKANDYGRDVGNVELFELFETDPKTQCKECLSYWSEGIVYCTCGHLLKERPIEVSLNIHWTFFQFQYTKSGREDLMVRIWENSRKERVSSGP